MLCLLGVDEELAACCVSLVGEESAEKAEGILSRWPVPLFDAYQREMGAERRAGRGITHPRWPGLELTRARAMPRGLQVAPDDLALRLDLALDEPSARFKEKECRQCGALSLMGAGPTVAGGGEQGRGLRPSTGDRPEATAALPPTLGRCRALRLLARAAAAAARRLGSRDERERKRGGAELETALAPPRRAARAGLRARGSAPPPPWPPRGDSREQVRAAVPMAAGRRRRVRGSRSTARPAPPSPRVHATAAPASARTVPPPPRRGAAAAQGRRGRPLGREERRGGGAAEGRPPLVPPGERESERVRERERSVINGEGGGTVGWKSDGVHLL
ncbi:hypothetical protein PVAP13_3KG027927 [Panicum virgatum]|uniref:Uncharacterized protein n=1 Tax=Panicum virgatum TaxID=38727 RepID=A0A8T0UED5_PANVG|nr:hypothetical protein PVAP13_3KG027927 [Panicum virgatum]